MRAGLESGPRLRSVVQDEGATLPHGVSWMLRDEGGSTVRNIAKFAALLTLVAGATFVGPRTSAQAPSNVEWKYYGADAGGTKYSPLDQINKDNVKDLRIAWRW